MLKQYLGIPPSYIRKINITIAVVIILAIITIIIKSWVINSNLLYLLIICELIIILCCLLVHRKRMSQLYKAISKLNKATGMSFTMGNTLGIPGITVLTFDTKNKKMAFCNTITGDYEVQNFDYITSWQLNYLFNADNNKKYTFLSIAYEKHDTAMLQVKLPIKVAEIWNKKLDIILHS